MEHNAVHFSMECLCYYVPLITIRLFFYLLLLLNFNSIYIFCYLYSTGHLQSLSTLTPPNQLGAKKGIKL